MPRRKQPVPSAVGQVNFVAQAIACVPTADGLVPRKKSNSPAGGPAPLADKVIAPVPPAGDPVPHNKSNSPAGGQRRFADQAIELVPPTGDLDSIIAEIRYWHIDRNFAMEQRKRLDLSIMSRLRWQLGWSRKLAKSEADKISKRARDLLKLGEQISKGKAVADDPLYLEWGGVISAVLISREPWDTIEATAVAAMSKLAASLPVWAAFGEPLRGFGVVSLAVIVGEAGDLSNYSNPAKLWKRMGLAVMDGVRQGGLKKGAAKEDWIAHGYNKQRRSRVFSIGDSLIKNNKGYYREVYLARKDFERAKAKAAGLTVVPAAKIPAKRKHEFMSDGHVHRRAQRYMEKRLLKNLWQAWRRAIAELQPIGIMPVATSSVQAKAPLQSNVDVLAAERPAKSSLQPEKVLPDASSPFRVTGNTENRNPIEGVRG